MFRYSFDPGLPEFIVSDRAKLNQILMNLVGNALKFTGEGRGVLLSAKRSSKTIILEVQDEGIGIPENQIESIFKPFIQADASTSRVFGGTGLGLSIVQENVDLIGGTLEVESKPGEGSIFRLKLPLKESEEVKTIDNEVFWSKGVFKLDNKILLIEDNPLNQEIFKAFMDRLGLSIDIAENGPQGIELARKINPDIIFLDMHMPALGGIETAQILRKINIFEKTPIVAVSADAFQQQKTAAFEAGVNDYLIKPLNSDKLYQILEKYLKKVESDSKGPKKKGLRESQDIQIQDLQKYIDKWKEIRAIPIFKGGTLRQLQQEISQLTPRKNLPLQKNLKELEAAIFEGNQEKLYSVINKSIDLLENPQETK